MNAVDPTIPGRTTVAEVVADMHAVTAELALDGVLLDISQTAVKRSGNFQPAARNHSWASDTTEAVPSPFAPVQVRRMVA